MNALFIYLTIGLIITLIYNIHQIINLVIIHRMKIFYAIKITLDVRKAIVGITLWPIALIIEIYEQFFRK